MLLTTKTNWKNPEISRKKHKIGLGSVCYFVQNHHVNVDLVTNENTFRLQVNARIVQAARVKPYRLLHIIETE